METLLTSIALPVAAVCAMLMGYAIQRGPTCTVAAMDEVVRKREFRRLGSMFEASLWATAGLLFARALHVLASAPAAYALSVATVLGGALLGLGAYVNRACVFGAIARLGSGEWAYAATPLGFYVGCVTYASVFPAAVQERLAHDSPVLGASPWLAAPLIGLLFWRLGRALYRLHAGTGDATGVPALLRALAMHVWSPHAATTVIGITFVLMLVLVGAWAYTDVLAELARGMAGNLPARVVLLVALFAGAVLGGWTAGRLRSTRIAFGQLLKCFAGGLLMGWGSLLIPGGNDGLILVGMPLLWPYAWVAFGTMCAIIGIALVAERTVMGRGSEQAVH